jgi:hypothetical protein
MAIGRTARRKVHGGRSLGLRPAGLHGPSLPPSVAFVVEARIHQGCKGRCCTSAIERGGENVGGPFVWNKLLNGYRLGAPERERTSPISVYQEDAERILYSSPFRRLQGKTQVHPFPIFDYLRTRLTHTIEVAYVGRVIATEVARQLKCLNAFGDIYIWARRTWRCDICSLPSP